MIEIDGSYGEGGGQILRTSIALAALLQKTVKIFNIRANRPKPGLAQQHLTGIKAVQRLTNAEVKGLKLDSTEIEFASTRKTLRGGVYYIDIGTAGSISLILQVAFPPCAFADSPVELNISGGTDVAFSPPMDYVKNVFCSTVKKMGLNAEIEILKRGYYPKGNGRVKARIFPVENFKPLNLTERGSFIGITGIAHSSNLPPHIVEREANAAKQILGECEITLECEKGFSTGTGIVLFAVYENSVLGASALGEIGKPAEKVGEEAAKKLLKEMDSNATLDKHMADQIIPYLALAKGESQVTVSEITEHLKTNIYITEKFTGCKFEIKGKGIINSKPYLSN